MHERRGAFHHVELDFMYEKLQGGMWEEDPISSSQVKYGIDIDRGFCEEGVEVGGTEDIWERVS